MNLADLVVILVAGVLAWRGWYRGALRQVFEYAGGFLGLLVGAAFGPRLVREYTDQNGVEAALLSLAAVFVCLSVGQILGYMVGSRFGAMAQRARLGRADQSVGAIIGFIAALFAYWLLGSVLVQGPSQTVAKQLSRSAILRWANRQAEPPDLLAYLEGYLNASGFPQVFVGLPPSIGQPVKLPAGPKARAAVREVQDSTVRIVVPDTCGGTQLGTGWIAAPNTVVTNAHVVAGGDSLLVEERDAIGNGIEGTVVLFDANLDLAVIKVDGLSGDPLKLVTRRLDVGTPGATVGYPGSQSGTLVSGRAAVQNLIDARGRDIYNRNVVEREVYELRADVEQGDSGGPFITLKGDVAGVIFAASTTDGDTGYALTGAEVTDEIEEGEGRTSSVGTGGCTH